MIEFSLLSSGSKANCLYLRCGETKVLIDCGLSAREACRRLGLIGVMAEEIQAIVVTHEHSDHVSGIPVFARKQKCPIFANSKTFSASRPLSEVAQEQRNLFQTGGRFSIGELTFEPFSVMHDAADPVAFRVHGGAHTLGVVTDLGQVTNLVREQTQDLDALILESNHDPLLLREAPYPWELKQRILGRSGHLSNETAGELLEHLGGSLKRMLRVVVAAHISENSNDPALALEVLRNSWSKTLSPFPEMVAANAYTPTTLFKL